MRKILFFMAVATSCGLVLPNIAHAQGASGCPNNQTAPAIKGTYVDNFGGLQAISTSFWTSGDAVFEVCSVDNTKKRIIAFNNPRNTYDRAMYSRFEWVMFQNRLWYCQSVHDAPSASAAASAAGADPSDPAQKGCRQFAWSTLIRILP